MAFTEGAPLADVCPEGARPQGRTDLAASRAPGEPVVRVPIEEVRLGETARLGEVSSAHLDLVAERAGAWGPLLVSQSGRIMDGHYRYLAARRLGHSFVECVIFKGDEREAFVEGVRRNVAHGLPLTLRERKSAASRILTFDPGWSDRMIAEVCGLAHETVGRLRESEGCPAGDIRHLGKRRGRDGKYQRVDDGETRARIVDAIKADPGASLRQVAREVGSSPETVRKLRRQIQEVPQPLALVPLSGRSVVSPSKDAAFVSTDAGCSFATWFERTSITEGWVDHIAAVPLSRVYEIADEALKRAAAWKDFAAALTSRVNS
jgi:hypothetical protein